MMYGVDDFVFRNLMNSIKWKCLRMLRFRCWQTQKQSMECNLLYESVNWEKEEYVVCAMYLLCPLRSYKRVCVSIEERLGVA